MGEASMPHGYLPSLGEHPCGTPPQAPQVCIGASMGGRGRQVNIPVATRRAAGLAGAGGAQGRPHHTRRGTFQDSHGHTRAGRKTTVFLHEPFIARSASPPACLRFKILVRKKNVRKICSDMGKVNHSHLMWVQPDVCGLFSGSVRSFSANVGWGAFIFSDNLG